MKTINLILLALTIGGCHTFKKEAMQKTIINTSNAPAPIGPYNQAVLSGNTLYVSGAIALDAKTGLMIQSDIESETHQVMLNLGEILKSSGMDYSNIVKATIFVTDLGNFAKINAVYGSYFKTDFPARETVQVSALPKNASVEISVIAVK
jgi:2-iminobutanoate/2-iminopropanoate deaminase